MFRRAFLFPMVAVTIAGVPVITPGEVAAAIGLGSPTFSGGAVAVAGGSYRLGGTLGEAGVVGMVSGGSFQLIEGYWRPNMGIATSVETPPGEPEPPGAAAVRFANAYTANLPNPFREATSIAFSVADTAPVSLIIYDVGGRHVRTLVNEPRPGGRHRVRWDGADDRGAPLASGLYFARLAIGTWTETKRILRIR